MSDEHDDTVWELFYWPMLQGRGELVRLILEDRGVAYDDVCREPGGVQRILAFRRGEETGTLPFAPPILRVGELVVAQAPLICSYVGERLGFAPDDEAGRLAARQVQLTVADVYAAAHDVHHPTSTALYFEDQREAAMEAAKAFHGGRLKQWLTYFERLIERSGGPGVVGALCYVDLSVFQMLEGLRYAFPKAMAALGADTPKLAALGEQVKERPGVAAYLGSERRLAFNLDGIFRYYPELDLQG